MAARELHCDELAMSLGNARPMMFGSPEVPPGREAVQILAPILAKDPAARRTLLTSGDPLARELGTLATTTSPLDYAAALQLAASTECALAAAEQTQHESMALVAIAARSRWPSTRRGPSLNCTRR